MSGKTGKERSKMTELERKNREIVRRTKKKAKIRNNVKLFLMVIVLSMIFSLPFVSRVYADQNGETWINKEYVSYINRVCEEKHLSPEMVTAIIEQESSGQANVVSSAGCVGLMQLNQSNEFAKGRNLYDWKQNIDAGTDYLIYLYEKFGDDNYVVLTAYWCGEYSVKVSDAMEGNYDYYPEKICKRAFALEELRGKHDYE